MIQLPNDSKFLDILWIYSQICMYWHTGSTLDKLSPLKAVAHSTSPTLFLHGSADALIPPSTLQELYDNCHAKKSMHMFKDSTHAQAITNYPKEYFNVVKDFLVNNNFTTIQNQN